MRLTDATQSRFRVIVSAIALGLLVLTSALAKPPGLAPSEEVAFAVGPEPAWAEAPWPEGRAFPVRLSGAGGVEYLLASEQHNPATEERHWRFVLRMKNPSGVQSGSQISIEFDPEFQSLTINRLDIVREGRRFSVLGSARWRVIQREGSLSMNIYSGERTAVCFIEDLRPGDLLDYSYTLAGDNPAFAGKWLDMLALGWDDPVSRVYYRVLIPDGRRIGWRVIGPRPAGLSEVERQLEGGTREVIWTVDDLPGFLTEGDEPAWFLEAPLLQISEMGSWAEVAMWGAKLYEAGEPNPALDQLVADLRRRAEARGASAPSDSGSSDAAGALAGEIVRFVQDEVRYQAFHNGISAFRPARPTETAARRFGDCKDKSRLLVDLLGRSGIRAWPALVSSRYRREVGRFLPSPSVFDHVIVRVDDPSLGAAWVDATAQDQGGRWDRRALARFGVALELREGAERLTEVVPSPESLPRTKLTTRIKSGPVLEPALVQIITEGFGEDADDLRSHVAESGESFVAHRKLREFWKSHPEATPSGPLRFEEDREANRFAVVENYRVPDFWEESEDAKTATASVYAAEIAANLPDINAFQRDTPIGLGLPREVSQKFVIELPESWNIETGSFEIDQPELSYRSKVSYAGQVVTLEFELKILTDHAPVERVREIADAVSKIRNDLGFEIRKTSPPLAATFRRALRALAEAAKQSAPPAEVAPKEN